MQILPVHYLESTDPVRSAVDPHGGDSFVNDTQDEAAAQVLMEALLTLAFGRDIVLSQSSVLDSYACQVLVRTVTQAQAQVSGDPQYWLRRPNPLRLHLFGVDSFPEALAVAFARIGGTGDDFFASSLYPDLQGSAQAVDVARSAVERNPENPLHGISGYRAELFKATWERFQTATKSDLRTVVVPRPDTRLDLDSSVRGIVLKHDAAGNGTVESRAAVALGALIDGTVRDQPFRYRSLLRCDAPWDSAVSQASALELAGSEDTLRLVREVVDTLYNRVVVASIGHASATYSTGVAEGSRVAAEDRAQQLALPSEGGEAQFELSVTKRDRADVHAITANREVSAFAGVLRDRETDEWKASLARIAGAAPDDKSKAFERHARMVAHSLAGVADLRADQQLGIRMLISMGGLAAATTGGLEVVGAFNPVVGGILAAGAAGAPQAKQAFTRGRKFRATRKALGHMVKPGGQ